MIYNNLEKENVLKMLKGDESAAEFISMMGQALHFWDDLVDKDQEVTDDTSARCSSTCWWSCRGTSFITHTLHT